MLRLGPLSTSTGFPAGGRRAAFAAKCCLPVLRVPGLIAWRIRATRQAQAPSLQGLGMGKQPLRQCIEAASFLGRQHLIEALLVAERDRHDAAVHGAAAGAQPERGAAAVGAVGRPLDQAALHQSGHRPAHRHLVHDDALPHIGSSQRREAAQGRHHPPLRHGQPERFGVQVVQRFRHDLGQNRQPIGEKILQFEGLRSGRHNSYI